MSAKKLFPMLVILPLVIYSQGVRSQYHQDWNPDADGDNSIGVPDLLALLSVFEEQDLDDDGIWDGQDDCVGTIDECGICNGTGPNIAVIDMIQVIYDSTFIPQLNEWYVFELGVDTTYTYTCAEAGCIDPEATNFNPVANTDDGTCVFGPLQCDGEPTITFDNFTYNLIGIGTQCWFAENLRSEHYANGEAILGNLSNYEWTSATIGAQTVYGQGLTNVYSGNEDEASNLETYGRLYNWHAAHDPRGICPAGWHVPSDEEWAMLTDFLGGASVAGIELKSSPLDEPGWDGNNSIGFGALPGGNRSGSVNSFYAEGDVGYWWTSSIASLHEAWLRELSDGTDNIARYQHNQKAGFSVRCVKN